MVPNPEKQAEPMINQIETDVETTLQNVSLVWMKLYTNFIEYTVREFKTEVMLKLVPNVTCLYIS